MEQSEARVWQMVCGGLKAHLTCRCRAHRLTHVHQPRGHLPEPRACRGPPSLLHQQDLVGGVEHQRPHAHL
jgi:hypothetical protein